MPAESDGSGKELAVTRREFFLIFDNMFWIFTGSMVFGFCVVIGSDAIDNYLWHSSRPCKWKLWLWIICIVFSLLMTVFSSTNKAVDRAYRQYDSGKIVKEYTIDYKGQIIDSAYVYKCD